MDRITDEEKEGETHSYCVPNSDTDGKMEGETDGEIEGEKHT